MKDKKIKKLIAKKQSLETKLESYLDEFQFIGLICVDLEYVEKLKFKISTCEEKLSKLRSE